VGESSVTGFPEDRSGLREPGAEMFSREIPALLVTHCMRTQEDEPGQPFSAAFGGGY